MKRKNKKIVNGLLAVLGVTLIIGASSYVASGLKDGFEETNNKIVEWFDKDKVNYSIRNIKKGESLIDKVVLVNTQLLNESYSEYYDDYSFLKDNLGYFTLSYQDVSSNSLSSSDVSISTGNSGYYYFRLNISVGPIQETLFGGKSSYFESFCITENKLIEGSGQSLIVKDFTVAEVFNDKFYDIFKIIETDDSNKTLDTITNDSTDVQKKKDSTSYDNDLDNSIPVYEDDPTVGWSEFY